MFYLRLSYAARLCLVPFLARQIHALRRQRREGRLEGKRLWNYRPDSVKREDLQYFAQKRGVSDQAVLRGLLCLVLCKVRLSWFLFLLFFLRWWWWNFLW